MVTLPIEMPKICKECIVSVLEDDGYFGWRRYCKLLKRYVNELDKEKDCPLQDNKSYWKVEYNEKRRKATYTCANCGTAYQVMLVSSAEIRDYADKFCRECGKEMTCAVRTVEPGGENAQQD